MWGCTGIDGGASLSRCEVWRGYPSPMLAINKNQRITAFLTLTTILPLHTLPVQVLQILQLLSRCRKSGLKRLRVKRYICVKTQIEDTPPQNVSTFFTNQNDEIWILVHFDRIKLNKIVN
jgi:hypothetical protein